MNRRERKAALREKEKREGQSRKTRRDQQRLGRLLVTLTVAAAIINVLILIFAIRSHFVGLEGDRGMAAALAMAYYGVWLILPSNRWGYVTIDKEQFRQLISSRQTSGYNPTSAFPILSPKNQ